MSTETGAGAGRGRTGGMGTAGTSHPEQGAPATVPLADCVRCGEPTEYPETCPGIVFCPVCAWQEAARSACSG
ncbi:hypothetical protein [Streptomyces pinistramenti]|uniref:hypothetical protein n=1 Tax=Streptomyces pinistramenti TaxID=2884812 RepID=UPI001D0648F6|nr:hypothetical protein [Streptomyces pinistramenti]MCB5906617.1 hypothetical protein [Streptomyces pinistramenti]